jgi:hypothetical protein
MKLFETIIVLAIGIAEGMLINDWRHVRQELVDTQFKIGSKKEPLVEKGRS